MNYNLDTEQGMLNACMWTKHLIDTVTDGGSWAVPRSLAVYTFNKKTQTVTRVNPEAAIDRVLTQLGWKLC